MTSALKPLIWVGSAKDDLRAFPEEVRLVMGYAMYLAQAGGKHPDGCQGSRSGLCASSELAGAASGKNGIAASNSLPSSRRKT